ncbi:hypothetical protein D4764_21G0000560 [Takifugu flavidus]|uniref:Alkylated DNA repair protein AlkB homologue 8 N-terminal domain-containing protein n=1 Tax=Takifugu flavidus TaxID=433684 RepID=A0A5C6NDK7_9TELE|nr:hypothetical protein D4764_21G0000560 [Takifugu flavidus]
MDMSKLGAVINCIKSSTEVQQNQHRDQSMIGSYEKIISNFKKTGVHGVFVDHSSPSGHKLEWSTNTDAVYKKAMSRLYFLRRLKSFSVCSRMLQMFYQSVMASTIFFAAVCWGAGIKAKDANRFNKLIKKAGSVVGCRLDNLDEVVRDRMVLKLRTIMDSPSHPLHNTVDKLRSSFSNRLLQPRCSKERYRKSFLPSAIRLYNSSKPSQ